MDLIDRIMDRILAPIYSFLDKLESAAVILLMITFIVLILAVIFLSIFKIRKISAPLSIITSAVLSSILMIPLVSAFNHYVTINVRGAISVLEDPEILVIHEQARGEREKGKLLTAEADRARAEHRLNTLRKESLDNQIVISNQEKSIGELHDKTVLIENSQLSMQGYGYILELAFLETNLQTNLARIEQVTPTKRGGIFNRNNYSYDEVLVITAYDINAKFGVDLTEVKVSKIDENTVIISGIKPKFIATSKFDRNPILSEYRQLEYRGTDLYKVGVPRTRNFLDNADKKQDEYEREFAKKLYDGLELTLFDDAVVKLSENFIRITLGHLYENIKFDHSGNIHHGALPLMDYLRTEIRTNNDTVTKLERINEDLARNNYRLETEASSLIDEYGFID